MDTVLEQSSPGMRQKERAALRPSAARWAVSELFLMNGALFGTWVSRIPAIQTERGLSHGRLGLALLALALGALVSMPMAGRLSSRIGSDRVCRTNAIIFCLTLPLLALTPGFVVLALGLFAFGLTHGALDVSMNAQAVAVERAYGRPIMSSFHALFSLGGLLGAALGGVAASFGVAPLWHFAAMSLALLAVTAVWALPFLLSDRHEETETETTTARVRPSPARPRGLVIIGVVAFCVMMGEGAMADWTGVFLRRELHSSEGLAAAAYAAFSIAMAATRFVGDGLIARIGAVGLARASGILAAGGLALALLSASPVLALVGFGLVGLGFATVVPMAFSAAGQMPGVPASVAIAVASTIGYFGFLVGPPLIGFIAEFLGLRSALTVILVTSLLIAVLAPAVRVRRG